jgi:hypothetical protein
MLNKEFIDLLAPTHLMTRQIVHERTSDAVHLTL